MLDAKKVYEGSDDGKQVHERLIGLRNSIAAHTDASDIVRLTLAVKDGQPFAYYFLAKAASVSNEPAATTAHHAQRFLEIIAEDAAWEGPCRALGAGIGAMRALAVLDAAALQGARA